MSGVRVAPFPEVLAAAGEQVRLRMGEVESLLVGAACDHGAELERSAGATLAAGGKRLRPLLVLICGREAKEGFASGLVRAGAAVELVHMATLVHDDVLDGALVRRGRPTVFASEGRRTATATGDFLFSRAFSLLAANGDPEQVHVLSDASVALARGELAQREDAFSADVDVERYLLRCELKTARLFSAACRLGSLAAGRPRAEAEALDRFGHRVGLAFQFLDDVLDVAGAPGQTGKQRGTDLLDGTTTLPLILAAREDPSLAALDRRSIRRREDAEAVCDRIVATGVLDEVRARAATLVEEAKEELDGVEPRLADLLRLVSGRIVERDG